MRQRERKISLPGGTPNELSAQKVRLQARRAFTVTGRTTCFNLPLTGKVARSAGVWRAAYKSGVTGAGKRTWDSQAGYRQGRANRHHLRTGSLAYPPAARFLILTTTRWSEKYERTWCINDGWSWRESEAWCKAGR